MSKNRRKKKVEADQTEGFGQSFGSLSGFDFLPVPKDAKNVEVHGSQADVGPTHQWWSETDDLRFEVRRKGFGGKTVTLCFGLSHADKKQRDHLANSLSKFLGVRAYWKETFLCVQGDQRARLRLFFEPALE